MNVFEKNVCYVNIEVLVYSIFFNFNYFKFQLLQNLQTRQRELFFPQEIVNLFL